MSSAGRGRALEQRMVPEDVAVIVSFTLVGRGPQRPVTGGKAMFRKFCMAKCRRGRQVARMLSLLSWGLRRETTFPLIAPGRVSPVTPASASCHMLPASSFETATLTSLFSDGHDDWIRAMPLWSDLI